MKKSNIKKTFSILLMIILLLFMTKVNAANNDSFNTTLRANAYQFKREETITITIGLKDISIESGEKGIGSYTAHIGFDPNVLEYVETHGTSRWKEPSYLNGNIAATTKDGEVVSDAQDIASITFKVKKDAKLGESIISLTKFSGSTAVTDVDADNREIKITIVDNGSSNKPGDDKPNGGNNNSGNNNKPNDENNNPGNNNEDKPNNDADNNGNINGGSNNNPSEKPDTSNIVDNSTKPGTLPKTGEINIIVPMAIVISTLSSIALFMGVKVFKGSPRH